MAGLPPRPQSVTAPAAPVAEEVKTTSTTNDADTATSNIKKHAPAKVPGPDGKEIDAPIPTVGGADLMAVSSKLWEAFKAYAAENSLDIETVVNACDEADKTIFPGHKSGRVAYATAGTIASLGAAHALLNKVRSGVAPMTKLKRDLEEKENKLKEMYAMIEKLQKQLETRA